MTPPAATPVPIILDCDPGHDDAVAILLAACPTAVNVFIQAKAYNVYADGAARIVALTTGLALVTLTALAVGLAG